MNRTKRPRTEENTPQSSTHRGRVINYSAWTLVAAYCDAKSLCKLAQVCTILREVAGSDHLWKPLCNDLWQDKQLHPLCRWTRIDFTDGGEYCTFKYVQEKTSKTYGSDLASFLAAYATTVSIDEIILWLENAVSATLEEVEQYKSLEHQDQLEFASYDDFTTFAQLYKQLMIIQTHLSVAIAQKQEGETRLKVLSPTLMNSNLTRKACPLPRYVIAKRIRQFEWKYVNIYRKLFGTDVLSVEMHPSSSPSLDSMHNELQSELFNCIQHIESTMHEHIDLQQAEEEARRDNRLLTWKQSYIASVEDSKRTAITYEELREFGDWAILFGDSLELCRFVMGGAGCITNRAFRFQIGNVVLQESRFCIPSVGSWGSIRRNALDWGWEVVINTTGDIRAVSFDPRFGFENHKGFYSKSIQGESWHPATLESPLASHPMCGLYRLDY